MSRNRSTCGVRSAGLRTLVGRLALLALAGGALPCASGCHAAPQGSSDSGATGTTDRDAAGSANDAGTDGASRDGAGDASPGATLLATALSYDQSGRLLGEYDQAGHPLEELIYLDDRIIATVRDGKIYAVQTDQLTTPRAVLSGTTAIWTWDPEPFGATSPNEDADGDGTKFTFDQRFPGQRFDRVTGLHQNFHRTYVPEAGRYVEADPIGLAGGPNLYAYAGGNPIGRADPLGLFEVGASAIGEAFSKNLETMGKSTSEGNEMGRSRTPYDGPGASVVNNVIVGPVMVGLNAAGLDNEPPAGCQGQSGVMAALMRADPRFKGKGWTFKPVTNKEFDSWTKYVPFSGYHWVVRATSPSGKKYILDPNNGTWGDWLPKHDEFKYEQQRPCPTCQ